MESGVYVDKYPYYNIILKSLTLRGSLCALRTCRSTYSLSHYLSEVWDIMPTSYLKLISYLRWLEFMMLTPKINIEK